MSRIRARDTKPEVILRRGLHARGLRFRLYRKDLPGKPDLVFPRYKVVVLVHGCFWHGHRCPKFKWPETRASFWKEKIQANCQRDRAAIAALQKEGWRVLIVWECAVRGPGRLQVDVLLDRCQAFIRDEANLEAEVSGVWR